MILSTFYTFLICKIRDQLTLIIRSFGYYYLKQLIYINCYFVGPIFAMQCEGWVLLKLIRGTDYSNSF